MDTQEHLEFLNKALNMAMGFLLNATDRLHVLYVAQTVREINTEIRCLRAGVAY